MVKHETAIIPNLEELIGSMHIEIPDTTLPDPSLLDYYRLRKDRKIYIDTNIDAGCVDIQREIMMWNIEDEGKNIEDRQPIYIYVISFGGDSTYMWTLVDAITMSKTPVVTVNIGIAASAACIIFIAGHKRIMTKNSTVVIHEGSASVAGDSTKVIDFTDSYKKELKRMKKFILERTDIPERVLSKKRNNDWELIADECLEFKVCDKIAETMDDII